MARLFSIDVPLFATAYIRAENEREALNIANAELRGRGIEFSNRYQSIDDNLCIDGAPFDRVMENDEEIALSPAMTLGDGKFGIAMIEEVDLEDEEGDTQ